MFLNKVILSGNLTRDPEKKALPSGMSVTSFSIAINRVWKDKDGTKQETVEYVNIVSFGKQADTIKQYFSKGDSIFVEGRIQTRSWEDKEGNKKYVTEVVLDTFQFVGGKKKETTSPSEPTELEKKLDEPEDESCDPSAIPF
jgi:single-strand DNA-binding protein